VLVVLDELLGLVGETVGEVFSLAPSGKVRQTIDRAVWTVALVGEEIVRRLAGVAAGNVDIEPKPLRQ
jgi:hypothetical protein